jgi:hypothetical protein
VFTNNLRQHDLCLVVAALQPEYLPSHKASLCSAAGQRLSNASSQSFDYRFTFADHYASAENNIPKSAQLLCVNSSILSVIIVDALSWIGISR